MDAIAEELAAMADGSVSASVVPTIRAGLSRVERLIQRLGFL
jgi:hypothetical protein